MHEQLSSSEVDLLQAALWDGDQAIAAFHRWCETVDFSTHIDQAQFRLMPLLHANLERLGVTHPLVAKIRQVQQFSRIKEQTRRRQAREVISLLAAADIEVLVTKGLALGQLYYSDPSLRPMEDIDLVVRPDDLMPSLALLTEAGWEGNLPLLDCSERRRRALFSIQRAVLLLRDGFSEVDLQWTPYNECTTQEMLDDYWGRTTSLQIADVSVLVASPTDTLIHTLLHGSRANLLSPMRWVADAWMILDKAGDQIDWDLVRSTAQQAHASERMDATLELLSQFVELPIELPMSKTRPSRIEKLELTAFSLFHGRRFSVRRRGALVLSRFLRILHGYGRPHIGPVLIEALRIMVTWKRV